MKDKVLSDVPNQILKKTLKIIILSIIFYSISFNKSNAQNPNASDTGFDHANENATVYGGDLTFADGSDYTSFCIDGEADIAEVLLENASGRVKQWIITDEDKNILMLPEHISDVNFDQEEVGIRLIWHLSYNGIKPLVDPSGQMKFTHNLNDIRGKFHLSNPITVEMFLQPTGGTLEGGPFEFCVGDGVADHIPDGAITLSGNMGTNSAWVITDTDGKILGLPATYSDVNFDEAPAGTCLVWHLSYEDNVSFEGVENAADLTGCFALTNPITVERNTPLGGTITGGPFDFTVGNGTADSIAANAITLTGNVGTNSKWVVTNEAGTIILNLVDDYTTLNFDGSGAGVNKIWHLSYEDGLQGLTPPDGADHLVSGLSGCFSLSNSINITKTAAASTGKFNLYPNPAKGTVNVELSSFSDNVENISIKVYTLYNIQVYGKDFNLKDAKATFNVSSFQDGVYFVRVTDNISGKTAVKSLVVD